MNKSIFLCVIYIKIFKLNNYWLWLLTSGYILIECVQYLEKYKMKPVNIMEKNSTKVRYQSESRMYVTNEGADLAVPSQYFQVKWLKFLNCVTIEYAYKNMDPSVWDIERAQCIISNIHLSSPMETITHLCDIL